MKTKEQYIICDNPVCTHKEIVEVPQMLNYIGKACPLCGENLLTEEDFDYHLKLLMVIENTPEIKEDEKAESVLISVKDGKFRTSKRID